MVYERFADDFVCGFEHKEDADNSLALLRERLAKFGLKLSEAKSGIVKFNQHELRTSRSFTFLGFEFYWKKARRGFRTVARGTSKKKFTSSLHNFKEWLKKNRSRPLGWLGHKRSHRLRLHGIATQSVPGSIEAPAAVLESQGIAPAFGAGCGCQKPRLHAPLELRSAKERRGTRPECGLERERLINL